MKHRKRYGLEFTKTLILMFIITGCNLNDNSLRGHIIGGESSNPSQDDPIPQQKTVLSGDKFIVEPTGGTPPYTYTSSTSGYLNTTTGEYDVPKNADLISENINVVDANGIAYIITIKTKGFKEKISFALPQGVDDQNYPTDAVWLPSGEILVSAIGSDYQGERWAVYKSTDLGLNWSRVDHFMGMSYDGESHPLSMAASGGTVFTCGYSYSYNYTYPTPNSRWEVRRSTDAGSNWQSADSWWVTEGDHVCYDIAVAPSTGYVYAAGYYDTDTERRWLIKESRDNGTTWSAIYDQSTGGQSAFQIDVSPSGKLYVLGNKTGNKLHFLKGEYLLGAWNWTTATSLPDVTPYGDYQLRGTLKVVSDTTAYYAYRPNYTNGSIIKTTDSGDTWSEVYAGIDFLQGLTVTANGDIIASGGRRKSTFMGLPSQWYVVRSTDNGATWTPLELEATLMTGKQPYGLPIVSSPTGTSVMTFGYNDTGYQISTALSSDSGISWSLKAEAKFLWSFYSSVLHMVRESASELYASVSHPDENRKWPWSIMRSLDNGLTWTFSDTFTAVGTTNVQSFIKGHDGALYATGCSNNDSLIRRSTGGVWTTVHTVSNTCWSRTNKLVSNGTQTVLATKDNATHAIYIYTSSNGTAWSLTASINPPLGIEQYNLETITRDSSGNLYLSLSEYDSLGAGTTTPVLLKSLNGGSNWSEIRRSTFGSYNGLLKIHDDKLYYLTGNSLDISTDGGATWSTDTNYNIQPSHATFIENKIYFYGSNPITLDWRGVIYSRNTTLNTWIVTEDLFAREEPLKLENKYYAEAAEPPFIELSTDEVYLNSTYSEPYWGYYSWLRNLATVD